MDAEGVRRVVPTPRVRASVQGDLLDLKQADVDLGAASLHARHAKRKAATRIVNLVPLVVNSCAS